MRCRKRRWGVRAPDIRRSELELSHEPGVYVLNGPVMMALVLLQAPEMRRGLMLTVASLG